MSTPTAHLEERLAQARLLLNLHCPFLGRLVTRVPVYFGESIFDAQTDRTMLCVNRGPMGEVHMSPSYSETLTIGQFNWGFAHEVLHLALGAFFRRNRRPMRWWNRNHDYIVNAMLSELARIMPAGMMEPPVGIWIDLNISFGRTAEELYAFLEARGDFEDESEAGVAGQAGAPGSSEGSGSGIGSTDEPSDLVEDPSASPEETERHNREMADRWNHALAEALQAQERVAGTMPGCLSEVVRSLFKTEIPFAEAFLAMAEGCLPEGPRTYLRPSKRGLAAGVALPRPGKKTPQLAVVFDTSKSIGQKELQTFVGVLRTLAGMYEPAIRVIEADAAVQRDYLIEDIEAELAAYDGLEIHGRGGTDFQDVLRVLPEGEGEPDLVLLLTDGRVAWPDPATWPCPVLVAATHRLPPEGYLSVKLSPAA